MSDSVIQTVIITGGAFGLTLLIGGMIMLQEWRQRTGRNSLESAKHEIEAKKLWANANEQLMGKKTNGY